MRDYQTPQREQQSRSSDLVVSRKSKETPSKKPQKIVRKSLNVVFTSASEDVSSKEPSNESMISGVSDSNHISEAAESFATLTPPDLTPSSKITTINFEESDNDNVECQDLTKSDGGSNSNASDLKLAANALKQARSQVSNLVDSDIQTKRLVDALIRTAMDGCSTLPEERDRACKGVSIKFRVTYLCFLLCILAVALISTFSSAFDNSLNGPPPT